MNLIRRINKTAREMCTIDRYSQTRLINPESVLEHTGFVCFCSLMIAGELNKVGECVDIANLMSKAAIHDIEETITGDISCPTKYANDEILAEIKKVERDAAEVICKYLDESKEQFLFQIWNEAKDGKDGFIVALSDKLAVVYKVQQEVEFFGNKTLQEHIDGLVPALELLYEAQPEWNVLQSIGIIREIITEARAICQAIKI